MADEKVNVLKKSFTEQWNEADGFFGKFDTIMGSDALSGSLGIIGSGLQIYNSIEGVKNSKKALNMQKEALDLQKQQLAIENDRYNKRENERIEANNTINSSANAYKLQENEKKDKTSQKQALETQELLPTERI